MRRETIHTGNQVHSISELSACDPFYTLTVALGCFSGFPWHCDLLFQQAGLSRGLDLQLSVPHMS